MIRCVSRQSPSGGPGRRSTVGFYGTGHLSVVGQFENPRIAGPFPLQLRPRTEQRAARTSPRTEGREQMLYAESLDGLVLETMCREPGPWTKDELARKWESGARLESLWRLVSRGLVVRLEGDFYAATAAGRYAVAMSEETPWRPPRLSARTSGACVGPTRSPRKRSPSGRRPTGRRSRSSSAVDGPRGSTRSSGSRAPWRRILRHHRRRRGFSQRALAERSGKHHSEIGLLGRGQRCPRLDTVVIVADALDLGPAELVLGLRPPQDQPERAVR